MVTHFDNIGTGTNIVLLQFSQTVGKNLKKNSISQVFDTFVHVLVMLLLFLKNILEISSYF